jgi:hypothetical protein
VYVNINNSHRVVQYSPEGDKLQEWEYEGEAPNFAVGAGGEVYVNINNSHRVVQYAPAGERKAEWTTEGDIAGIAVGPNNQIFLADRANSCVRIIQPR